MWSPVVLSLSAAFILSWYLEEKACDEKSTFFSWRSKEWPSFLLLPFDRTGWTFLEAAFTIEFSIEFLYDCITWYGILLNLEFIRDSEREPTAVVLGVLLIKSVALFKGVGKIDSVIGMFLFWLSSSRFYLALLYTSIRCSFISSYFYSVFMLL